MKPCKITIDDKYFMYYNNGGVRTTIDINNARVLSKRTAKRMLRNIKKLGKQGQIEEI